jgi:hypothetical protein
MSNRELSQQKQTKKEGKEITCVQLSCIKSRTTPKICIASSRVGVMITTPVPFLGWFGRVSNGADLCQTGLTLNSARSKSSMQGTRNANVLPEPVFPSPSTFLPARSGGMHFCCESGYKRTNRHGHAHLDLCHGFKLEAVRDALLELVANGQLGELAE